MCSVDAHSSFKNGSARCLALGNPREGAYTWTATSFWIRNGSPMRCRQRVARRRRREHRRVGGPLLDF